MLGCLFGRILNSSTGALMAVKNMDVSELKALMDQGQEYVLVDVREQNEWDEAHIDSARLLPLSDFENNWQQLEDLKDKKIILQCRSGKRSMTAGMKLEEH